VLPTVTSLNAATADAHLPFFWNSRSGSCRAAGVYPRYVVGFGFRSSYRVGQTIRPSLADHFLLMIFKYSVTSLADGVQNDIAAGSATQKAGCRGRQAVAGNRGGLRSCDARQGSAAKSGPV